MNIAIRKLVEQQLKNLLDYFKMTGDQWTINETLKGVPEKHKKLYECLLMNQVSHLNAKQSLNPAAKIDDAHFMVPLVKRIIDKLIITKEIVGWQPMSGPVGLVYTLQMKPLPQVPEAAEYNGVTLKRSTQLEIISEPVSAKTKKIEASIDVCDIQDGLVVHGIDIEKEMTDIISEEICYEIIEEIINDIVALAEKETVVFDESSQFVSDKVDKIMETINKASNKIAIDSMRGRGNFIITTPVIISMLQSKKNLGEKVTFITGNLAKENTNNALYRAGLICLEDKPICDVYCSLSKILYDDDNRDKHKVVIGYKGKSGETDAGYIYCPYVMTLGSLGISPTTFNPTIGLMSRYGKLVTGMKDNQTKSPYYKVIEVDTADFFK